MKHIKLSLSLILLIISMPLLVHANNASNHQASRPQTVKTEASKSFNLEHCLNGSTTPTAVCINQALTKKTIPQCYALTEKIKSLSAKEKIADYCFYEISEFSHLNACLFASSKFYIGENKDAALFECYRQFAPSINKKVCQKISQSMTYPEKRSYMMNQCETL